MKVTNDFESCAPSHELHGWARACLVAMQMVLGSAMAADFHVAPDGNDDWPGTSAQPFATLTRARDAARNVASGAPRRIVVRDGKYFNVSCSLGPEDSDLLIEAAPGENPILFGGQPIRGWAKDGEEFYSADLPPFPRMADEFARATESSGWEIRMLLVAGEMASLARYPHAGTLSHLTSFDVPWMSTTGGGWKRKPTTEELTTMRYQSGDLVPGLEIKNAEVTVYHMWDESRVGVARHDPASQLLVFNSALGHPPGAFGVKKFVVWNIREGMSRPGQWYHDRARGRLVYWPQLGQDMGKTEIIAPTTTSILRLRGTPKAKVRNVTVRGMGFAVTSVPLVAGGFAAARFNGAIDLENSENCALVDLTVSHVAGHAINNRGRFDAGTRVENCVVNDCGAGGIYVGGANAVVHNNHVRAVGLSFPSAVGIYRGGVNCRVSHNEVHNCSYSAINYGGVSNVIESNLIYDCMKVLHDGAAIYLFAGTNCIVRGNLARDILDTGGYGASAYYLDERSTGCVVEGNLSVRVGWPSHNHMATNNVIRDNVFIANGDLKLTFPRSTGFTFERNVLDTPGKIRIENPSAVTNWSGNLFFSGAGKIEQVDLKQYSRSTPVEGPPANSTVADPLFEDRENGDFRYKSNSPSHALGLRGIDPFQAGRLKR